MPNKAKSHEQWMQLICGVCVRKDKKDLRKINADTLAMIKKHHYENYCLSWMPKVLCKSCLNILKVKESGVETNKKLLQINYDEMQRPNTQTRACPTSLCHFCAVGKMNGGEFMHYQAQMRQKVGHVKKAAPDTITICDSCKSHLSPGLPHDCTKTSRRENLFELVRESSTGTREIVVSRLIDSLCEDKNVNKKAGSLELRTRGSKPKTIGFGKFGRVAAKKQFSTEDLLKIQSSFNFSDRKLVKLANVLRVAFQSRNIIEPGLKDAINERNQLL